MEICVVQDLFNRPRPTTRLPNAKEKNTVSQCPWDEKQSELRRAIFFYQDAKSGHRQPK